MKKLLLTTLILSSTTVFAQTTMCFKQNHSDITTIEQVKLQGGECKSAYTLNEMKNNDWRVDDIKITSNPNGTNNFVYILKKGLTSNFNSYANGVSQEELEERLLKKLNNKRVEENKQKELAIKLAKIEEAKNYYIAKCQSCHGSKGEISAYNTSRKLNILTLDEIDTSIIEYKLNQKDNGNAIIMTPYAKSVTSDQLEGIYNYLKSINK